eukprot:1188253-Prorocentrum_minimum.AAC.1
MPAGWGCNEGNVIGVLAHRTTGVHSPHRNPKRQERPHQLSARRPSPKTTRRAPALASFVPWLRGCARLTAMKHNAALSCVRK